MSLKRQTAWSLLPTVTITIVSFFSLPLVWRYLGEEMYAVVGYISAFTGMFGFMDLGLGVAVGRYVGVALGKNDKAAARGYWGTGNLMALPLIALMGALFAILGGIFGPQWFRVSPENVWLLRACLAISGLSLFLNYYAQVWNILLQAHLDFKFTSQTRVVYNLVQMVPTIIIAWATRSVLWLSLWGVFISAITLIVTIRYARHRYGLGFAFGSARKDYAREMLPYTAKTFATTIAGSVAFGIDRMILGRLAPDVTFNRYYVSTNVGIRLQGVGSSVMGPVFHNTSRAIGEGSSRPAAIYDEMFTFMFGFCLLAGIWTALWHPIGLRLWLDFITGKNISADVSPIFTPVIVAFCFSALGSVSAAQLGPFNRAGMSLVFTILGGVCTGVGVYLGWRVNEIVGVAYGLLASRIVCVMQDFYVMRLANARGWLNPRIWMNALVQMCVGGVFGLVYLFLPVDSWWLLVPAMLHGTLVSVWLMRQQIGKALREMGSRWPLLRRLSNSVLLKM